MKQALSRAIISKQIDIENIEEIKFEDFQQFCEEQTKKMEDRRRSRVTANQKGEELDAKRLKTVKMNERAEMRNILANTAVFNSKYDLREPDPRKAEL